VSCGTAEGGEPVIVGAVFVVGGGLVLATVTVIVKAGSDALATPSLTLITIGADVPAAVDAVPDTRPICAANVAHDGRPLTLKTSGSLSASLAVGVNE
jgi:hypothetical protein